MEVANVVAPGRRRDPGELDRYIFNETAKGARLLMREEDRAILLYGHPINHILHFLIGFLTCGAWWLVWLVLAATSGERRVLVGWNANGELSAVPAGTSPVSGYTLPPARQNRTAELVADARCRACGAPGSSNFCPHCGAPRSEIHR